MPQSLFDGPEQSGPAEAPNAGPADQLQSADPSNWPVATGWQTLADDFFAGSTGQKLLEFLRGRLADGAVLFPPQPLRALALTPPEQVRVVILGQDPYHGRGQAEGLAFSVASGVALPPSLRNIFKERLASLQEPVPEHGSLVAWARRGVLLLNTSLTVEEGQPASHAKKGWETLTDALLEQVAKTASPCVYLLWGAHAQAKAGLIERTALQHGRDALILQANHPSPLSALRQPVPFLGCGHFATARDWLAARGHPGIV